MFLRLITLYLSIGCIFLFPRGAEAEPARIGVCCVAAGVPIAQLQKTVEGVRQNLCPKSDVALFIFGAERPYPAPSSVTFLPLSPGRPDITALLLEYQDRLMACDYLFVIQPTASLTRPLGEEVLQPRVAVEHPAYPRLRPRRGRRAAQSAPPSEIPFERNRRSAAFVSKKVAKKALYCTKNFYGGTRAEMLTMAQEVQTRKNKDQKRGLRAVQGEESYLNRYWVDHPATLLLPASSLVQLSREAI